MNIKIIITLCLPALLMGFASVYGFTEGIEWILWLVLFIAIAFIIARNVSSKFFLHGFIIGFLSAILKGLIQYFMFDTYLVHNPIDPANLAGIPAGFEVKTLFLIASPIIGLISGTVVGLFAVIAGIILKKTKKPVGTDVVS